MWINCIIDIYKKYYVVKQYYRFYIDNPDYRKNIYLY